MSFPSIQPAPSHRELSGPQEHETWSYRRLIGLWLALLAIPLLAVGLFAVQQPVQVLPRIGLAPGFLWSDLNGQTFSSELLRGKLVVYNFTSATCTAPCLDTSAAMQQLQDRIDTLDTGGLPVTLVTVLLDGTESDPALLRTYAARWKADPERWRFVTAPADRLKQGVGGGFGLYYTATAAGEVTFAPLTVLVDGNGILRAQYKRTLPDLAFVERDLGLIAAEVRNSSGAGGLVYEAAHLFACYASY